jgi:hypothetical protein
MKSRRQIRRGSRSSPDRSTLSLNAGKPCPLPEWNFSDFSRKDTRISAEENGCFAKKTKKNRLFGQK